MANPTSSIVGGSTLPRSVSTGRFVCSAVPQSPVSDALQVVPELGDHRLVEPELPPHLLELPRRRVGPGVGHGRVARDDPGDQEREHDDAGDDQHAWASRRGGSGSSQPRLPAWCCRRTRRWRTPGCRRSPGAMCGTAAGRWRRRTATSASCAITDFCATDRPSPPPRRPSPPPAGARRSAVQRLVVEVGEVEVRRVRPTWNRLMNHESAFGVVGIPVDDEDVLAAWPGS